MITNRRLKVFKHSLSIDRKHFVQQKKIKVDFRRILHCYYYHQSIRKRTVLLKVFTDHMHPYQNS